MEARWSPLQVMVLLVITTACLCLVIITCGTLLLAFAGKLTNEQLGYAKGLAIGGGFIGLASLFVYLVKIAFNAHKDRNTIEARNNLHKAQDSDTPPAPRERVIKNNVATKAKGQKKPNGRIGEKKEVKNVLKDRRE